MIYGMVLIFIGLILLTFEIYAKYKRNKIKEFQTYIHKGDDNKSILDYYLRSINHESILKEVKGRVNPKDYSDDMSTHQLKNLIKQFVDFEKEKTGSIHEELILKLNHEGLNTEVDMNHNTDEGLVVILDGNRYEPYSVLYGNYHDVIDFFNGSGHNRGIISSDVYEQLTDEHIIEKYEGIGYKIINGSFSLNDVGMIKKKVNKSINQISELSGKSTEFGAEYFDISVNDEIGKVVSQELSIKKKNAFISDFMYIVLMAVCAIGLSNALSYRFGYLGLPMGVGLGIILGIYFGNFFKSSFKNSKVYKGLDYFSKKHTYGFAPDVIDQIGEVLFNYSKVNAYNTKEKELYELYRGHVNPYLIKKPILEAVLCYEALKKSELLEDKISSVVMGLHEKLMEICDDISKKQYKYNIVARRELKRRLFGEIILKNKWMLHDSLFNKKEIKIMTEFYNQKDKMRNYPYELSADTSKLVKNIAFVLFNEYDEAKHIRKELNYGRFMYTASVISILAGGYLVI